MTESSERQPTETDETSRTIVEEHHVPVAVTEERKLSGRSFLAGFVTAVVLAVIAAIVFLAVSDSDDDGEIQIDVPTVDVDVDG